MTEEVLGHKGRGEDMTRPFPEGFCSYHEMNDVSELQTSDPIPEVIGVARERGLFVLPDPL